MDGIITDLMNNLAMKVQAVTFQFLKIDMSEIDYIKIFLGSVTDINNRFYNILVATGFGHTGYLHTTILYQKAFKIITAWACVLKPLCFLVQSFKANLESEIKANITLPLNISIHEINDSI